MVAGSRAQYFWLMIALTNFQYKLQFTAVTISGLFNQFFN